MGFEGKFQGLVTKPLNATSGAIDQVRDQLIEAFRLQAEQIQKLQQSLAHLQNQQNQLEKITHQLMEPLEAVLSSAGSSSAPTIRSVLLSVRNLIKATDASQVFEALTEETARMNIRSAIFDVRGMAAWGSSASGFGTELSSRDLRSLVVLLNHDGPFRRVLQATDAIETHAGELEGNRNLLETFKLAKGVRVLLLPIQSAGAVAAILYADSGEGHGPIPADPLRILVEFAGAQLDRLIALSGGYAAEAAPQDQEEVTVSEPAMSAESRVQAAQAESDVSTGDAVGANAYAGPETLEAPSSEPAVLEPAPVLPETEPIPATPQAAPQAPDVTQLSEEDQQIHRDARRFSKLLVSEIELYNKTKVDDGRKNKDLYHRLKADIDRSRQTYEKRFGNTVAKRTDYFHEELVRTLAGDDPSLLGSDYPGSSA